jgi:hypothetical protein
MLGDSKQPKKFHKLFCEVWFGSVRFCSNSCYRTAAAAAAAINLPINHICDWKITGHEFEISNLPFK